MAEFEFPISEQYRTRRVGQSRSGDSSLVDQRQSFQSALGNSAVARLLQREEAPEEEELQAKHDLSSVQREEAPEEEELQASHDAALAQREEAPEEEELQAAHDSAFAQRESAPEVGLAGGAVSDGLAGRIDSQRGGGSPLDGDTRSTMEGALGTSLNDVRVHVGAESVRDSDGRTR